MQLRSLLLAFAAAPALASAHHGTRFLLTVDFDMVRQPFFFFDATYAKFRGGSELELEPALVLPLGRDGMSELEVHAHISRADSEPLKHEATGFELRRRLNKSEGWNYAATVEYATTQKHIEDPNELSGAFVAGKEDAHGALVLNLAWSKEAEPGSKLNWGYKVAYAPPSETLVNFSVEAVGDFTAHASHEILFGASKHLDLTTMLKLGVGFGLTTDSPRYSLHFGLVRAL